MNINEGQSQKHIQNVFLLYNFFFENFLYFFRLGTIKYQELYLFLFLGALLTRIARNGLEEFDDHRFGDLLKIIGPSFKLNQKTSNA